MKNCTKLIGIIALVGVIVFSMIACDDGGGGGNSGSNGNGDSKTYTVTYNGNGNNSGAAPTDSGSPYASGATVTVLGNTGSLGKKAGHFFAGWNTAINGRGTAYSAGMTFTINANTTLYAQWTRLYIGNIGPGGGIVFYYSEEGFIMTDTGEVCHYLETAPAFMVASLRWSTATGSPFIDISDTESAIGTGRRNTALILALDPTAPAAKACNDFRTIGKDDWFLPSSGELNQLYINRIAVGDLSKSLYWSSSQGEIDIAMGRNFDNGASFGKDKSSVLDFRAIRAF